MRFPKPQCYQQNLWSRGSRRRNKTVSVRITQKYKKPGTAPLRLFRPHHHRLTHCSCHQASLTAPPVFPWPQGCCICSESNNLGHPKQGLAKQQGLTLRSQGRASVQTSCMKFPGQNLLSIPITCTCLNSLCHPQYLPDGSLPAS